MDAAPRRDSSVDAGPRPDAAEGCSFCDPFDLATCTGGEVCEVNPFFAGTDPGICRPDGLIERGEMCIRGTGSNDCIAGHVCFDDYGCIQTCRSNLDCAPRGVCMLIADGGCVGLCNDPCSALAQTGCAPGRGCEPLGPMASGASSNLCRFANPAGVEGTRCFKPRDCAAGHVCIDDPSTMVPDDGLCTRLWPCAGAPCSGMAVTWGDDPDGTPICSCPV